MKIFINTDMEGVCAIVDWEEASFKTGRGIGYIKNFLTGEVNAAIKGVLSVDKDAEIVVQDGHYGGYWGPNLIIEDLNPRATLIQGKRGTEMIGFDGSFDLLLDIGAHSMAGTPKGLMNHTIAPHEIINFWINNMKVGEIGIRAAIAGHHGVSLGMVTGDYWAVEEARALLGDIEGVAVKKGLNMYTAECMNPYRAQDLIREAAVKMMGRLKDFKAFKFDSPVEIKIEYAETIMADRTELKSGAVRVDGRTIILSGDDLIQTLNRL